MYASGLRISELVGIDLDDLELRARLVKVRGKGKKERIVPFGTKAQAAIPAEPPKKIVVDDTEPPKKAPAKKKSTAKKPADTTKPGASQAPNPPAQQGTGKPQ